MARSGSRTLHLSLLSVLVASSCGPDPAPSPVGGFVERDSAGVMIVENHTPEWGPGNFWTVDSEPDFVIGGPVRPNDVSADSSHLVWSIIGVAPLSDGRVALLSAAEKRVLLFEPSGIFSVSIGREGRGPGEFSDPEHLEVRSGDTIVVWDSYFGRVDYFDAAGTLLKERTIDLGAVVAATRTNAQRSPESVHRPLPDGSFLVKVHRNHWEPPREGELYRQPVKYVRIDSAYSTHSFGWWDGREYLSLPDPAPWVVPFPAASAVAAGGSPFTVYVTNGDYYQVHQFSAAGSLRRLFRRSHDPKAITRREVEEWKKANTELSPWVDWTDWDRAIAALPARRFHPPILGLHVDTEGYLWVADRITLSHGDWSVFSEEGRWLGTVRLPVGLISWIGEDLVIGIRLDFDLGYEVIEGYSLNRSAGTIRAKSFR